MYQAPGPARALPRPPRGALAPEGACDAYYYCYMSLMWSKVSSLQFSYWLGQAGIVHIGLDQRVLTAVSEIREKKTIVLARDAYYCDHIVRTPDSTISHWLAMHIIIVIVIIVIAYSCIYFCY